MARKSVFLIIFVIYTSLGFGQIGGRGTYAFLNLTNAARIASLGGKNVSLPDSTDLSMPFHNPSLLQKGMHHHMVLNYVNYFADINYGYFSIAKKLDDKSNAALGIHYMNYGSFVEANSSGVKEGTFSAMDYVFNLIYSRKLDSLWTVGLNVKPILSVYEKYTSVGLVSDIGIHYYNSEKLLSAGLVLRNLGTQIKPYYQTNYEPVAFEIIAGITQKLRYAPFAFSLTAHQLQRPDLTYKSNIDEPGTELGQPTQKSKTDLLGDKVMRHIIAGVEFNPMKNFFIHAGYNYQRRKEMTISTRTGLVGFSIGFGIKISKLTIDYGRASYNLAGASNHFSLSVNLDEI